MYFRCPGKIFLLHLNRLHYYKLHPQKCKKMHLHIKLSFNSCLMPAKYPKNLVRLFLSKNRNLSHFTKKKTHWKNPKIYPGVIFCCWSLHKVFMQLPRLFRVCEFPPCFPHKKLIGDISVVSAVMKTKLIKWTHLKLFYIWAKKALHKYRAVILSHWDNVKWKNVFKKFQHFCWIKSIQCIQLTF